MNKSPEQLYTEREKRVNDAIQLKVPDRVPVMSLFGFSPARYKDITFQEAMYDYDKVMTTWVDTMLEFQPDTVENPFFYLFFGSVLDALEYKQLKWPGRGVDVTHSFQYIEGEYMKADEYDDFLFDPTDFMIRKYWPRIFGALDPFGKLPHLSDIISYSIGLPRLASFDTPDISQALESIMKAAKAAQRMISGGKKFDKKIKALGFPPQWGAMTQAPFDTLSDFFRGTKGTMLDMFRMPDKVIEAAEKLLPIMLRLGLTAGKRGVSRVFIPLHKGLDGFMSPEQFNSFFWPTLRKLITGLMDGGLNPCLLWEGDCSSRLETIADIPKGKAIYWFERTDVFKAKEILGDRVCIRGNVPLSIMCTGTPDDVKKYCKKLIDIVGKGGGLIMDCSTVMDDAKPENLKAMIDFTKEYGVYT